MLMKDIDVRISEKLVPYLYTFKDGQTVTEKVTLSIVLGLFSSHSITLEKAAELADKNIWEFIDILKHYQIPWGEYTEEEVFQDQKAIQKLLGGEDD